jgi:FixJ family two-component response regulator
MSAAPLIHVIDDDESYRTALLRLLAAAGFEARGYGSTGEFLLHRPPDRPGCVLPPDRPGCVLLDLRLPGPSGLDLQEALPGHGVALPIVFLSGHADVPSTVKAMKGGAVDFLTKPVEREALFEALRRALERDARDRAARQEASELRSRLAALTPREREILEGIAGGKLNKQIARDMGIAERTVKLHRAHAMAKLGAGSPAELGGLAERLRRLADQ